MRWIPEWLGDSFARLYLEFGEDYFSSEEARDSLDRTRSSVRVVLSKLLNEGYLSRKGKGRRVLYRCLDPYEIVLRVAGNVQIPQEEYAPLVKDLISESLKFLGDDLISIVLYGSMARGEAHENSDMDVLLVSRNLPDSFSERAEYLYPIKRSCRGTIIELWKDKGIYCTIQLYPLLPSELDKFRPLFLDIVKDGRMLFDRQRFMEEKLKEWRKRLSEAGARRVSLPNGRWYWDLNSDGRKEAVKI